MTLAEAHRYAERYDVSMIRKALKVRSFASRRIAVQDSTLEIPKIDDPESPFHGERPPPQYLDMQIEITMNLIIDKHRKAVLKDLKYLMFGNDAVQSWYRVFLTVYILLSTNEFAYQWQLRYVKMADGTVRYPFFYAFLLELSMILMLDATEDSWLRRLRDKIYARGMGILRRESAIPLPQRLSRSNTIRARLDSSDR